MEISTQHAILLGRHQAWLRYALEGLKGNTALEGKELADYLEERIAESNLEIKNSEYEHWNNPKGNEESTESNTEAVTGQK